MSTPPPYRMTPGPARQEDRDQLAADLAFWPQARPALRPHVEALITLLQHGDGAEIVTLTGDDRLLAALHLVREPLLVDWAIPTRTEPSLMLCHLVKSPDAPVGEPVLRLVTLWATAFAARLGRQWIRGEVPLSPGSPANGLLALAKDTGWGHEKTVSAPSGEVALVQYRAEPRPHLDLFLHCQVPILPVPAGPTAVRHDH
ncbi:hypothetical protein [Streptomyces canus]|uniref:hypothetical protein n=1 Tax=Streptomyces canus TaxID=58343 RepID=UPI00277F29FE|nr:hypothetical protein [Streptomyces canus]MDQ0765582.1 hypothetical protein [Streptomyces canus]